MRVAVLTLTRDRLDYTKHCFASLHEFAGHPFDHYVLDQGSTDGTAEWLLKQYHSSSGGIATFCSGENVGIGRGVNLLTQTALSTSDYDAIVRFDNDCELTQPDTLKRALELLTDDLILSPRVLGLNNPPDILTDGLPGFSVGFTSVIGGIFMAYTRKVAEAWRYPEDGPLWGGDETAICNWMQARGGHVGYLMDVTVNHYRTTNGQHEDYPAYFDRRVAEGGPA